MSFFNELLISAKLELGAFRGPFFVNRYYRYSSPERKFRDGVDWKGAIAHAVETVARALTPNLRSFILGHLPWL
jgi:hypothetical protein